MRHKDPICPRPASWHIIYKQPQSDNANVEEASQWKDVVLAHYILWTEMIAALRNLLKQTGWKERGPEDAAILRHLESI